MEFLKTINRKSFFNEIIYIVLNIGLAISLMLIIQTTQSLWLALLLVLVSLWRLFAVRPRFWFAHIQVNAVNIIVSVGFVTLLYAANSGNASESHILLLRVLLTALYIGWLLFLKPQSKRIFIVSQAAVGLFVGTTAIFTVAYNWFASPVVILMWLVGYGTARHICSSYDDESHIEVISMIWGVVMAELAWLAYHWTIAYRLPIIGGFLLPQASIVMLCVGFVGFKSYDSFYKHQKIRFNDIVLPLIFSIAIISVFVLFFNGIGAGTV